MAEGIVVGKLKFKGMTGLRGYFYTFLVDFLRGSTIYMGLAN